MLISKRSLLEAFLASCAAISLGFERAADAATGDSKSLIVQTTQVPPHFNGAIQSGLATALVSSQVFASPLRFDDKWNPKPYLAKSWDVSPDGLSFTLHLVDNAVFHDGHPLTSEDVAYTIGVIKANHPFKSMLEPVVSVDTPDPYTVIIHLSKLHPALPLAMSPSLMPILPKHIYGDGQDIKTHPANLRPVGCGPFRFIEYKQAEYVTLEKFDKFFIAGRPKIDRVVQRIIPDENGMVIAAERGDVNVFPFVSGVRDIDRLEKSPKLDVTAQGFEGIGAMSWLAFNTRKAPLDDVRVRQALAFAANRDFIISKLFDGKASMATGPIVPTSPFYEPDVELYKYDVAKAEQLLDAAGHPKGADGTRFSLTIDYVPGVNESQRNIAEYLRAVYKKVGVVLEVRAAPDFLSWAQHVSNFDFDLTMDIVWNWGDPVIGVARTYLSNNIRKGVIWSNTQQYSNPKVDQLLNAAAIEPDVAKRKALYSEFQKIVVHDVPIMFVNVLPFHVAFTKDLDDLPLSIWGVLSPLDELEFAAPKKT